MNSRVPLWISCWLVLLLAFVLGWTEYANWREVVRLEQRFSDLELDSAAAEFQARLLKLQGTWAGNGFGSRDGGDAAFAIEGNQLKDWLHSLQRALGDLGAEVAAERDLVAQVSARFDRYLDTARRSAGEPVLQRQAALAFLHDAAELVAPTLEKLNIELTVEPGEELYVRIDSAQMKQVLINLIQNAADSIGQAVRIVLRARRAVLPLAARRTEAVALEVEDTGRGIPPEVQARLFDPFFTTKASGTGLGLAIAERISQKHGGSLQYRTQSGCGATFSVVLPNADSVEMGNDEGPVRLAAF